MLLKHLEDIPASELTLGQLYDYHYALLGGMISEIPKDVLARMEKENVGYTFTRSKDNEKPRD